MAIYAITGRPRHGKTHEMTRVAIQEILAGRRIFSNLKFNLGVGALKKLDDSVVGDYALKEDRENPKKLIFYWVNMHDWEHFEKGTILVDEGHRYFNSRQWEQLSEDVEIKLQQHGKDDLDVYLTVQHYKRIDVLLRELVEIWYEVETVFGNPDNMTPFLGIKVFRITGVEGIEYFEPYINSKLFPDSKMEIPMKQNYRMFKKKYALCYDTRAKVGRSEAMPLIHKSRRCMFPGCGAIKVTHA